MGLWRYHKHTNTSIDKTQLQTHLIDLLAFIDKIMADYAMFQISLFGLELNERRVWTHANRSTRYYAWAYIN